MPSVFSPAKWGEGNGWKSTHPSPSIRLSDSSGDRKGPTRGLPSELVPRGRLPRAPDPRVQHPPHPHQEAPHSTSPKGTPGFYTCPHPTVTLLGKCLHGLPSCSSTPGSSPSLSLTHQIYSISQTCQVHFLHMSVHLATSTATTLMQIAFQCPPLRCCGPLPDLPAPLPRPPAPAQ